MSTVAQDYLRYWGKADPAVGGLHLAAFHSIDVASVAEVMMRENVVLRSKFERLLALPVGSTIATVAAFCALHDVGKIDARFQVKVPDAVLALGRSGEWGNINGTGFDHGAHGYGWFHGKFLNDQQLFEQCLGGEGALELLAAVCGHHGFVPSGSERSQVEARLPWSKKDERARWQFVCDIIELYRGLGAAFPFTPKVQRPLQMLLAGLCSVADWVGSQVEYARQPLFVYEQTPCALSEYRERALQRAKRIVGELALGRGTLFRAKAFGELFVDSEGKPFAPRDAQQTTEANAGTITHQPALVLVEAAMGSGKTEAALSLTAQWLATGLASGLYVGLPTMATANGIFSRVKAVAAKMFAEAGTIDLRLAHGNARRIDAFEQLCQRALCGRSALRADSGTDETEAEVQCARWFLSSKRALLAQVGVGTVDQAMLSVLRTKHGFVRLFGLASSVVIIDEIHAYDAYMEVILERLVEYLGALSTPVVLLSATLPMERRATFAESYFRGLTGQQRALPIVSTSYPLVTVVDADGVRELRAHSTEQRTLSISCNAVTFEDSIDPEHEEVVALVEAARNGEMVVWIRNTVADARKAFEAVRQCARARNFDNVLLFHSRFRVCDRARIEEEVLRVCGKEGIEHRKGFLLIATQVVEQSLDVDFDRMVTDLAPIDLVLQRSGRFWRWGATIKRPSSAKEVLRVLLPSEENLASLEFGGSGSVYDRATLWLTADALQQRSSVQLPEELRSLIEDCYHSQRRSERIESAPNRDALRREEEKLEKELEGLRGRADRCSLPEARTEASPVQGNQPDDEETVRALTRVGRTARFLPVWWDHHEHVVKTLDGDELLELNPDGPSAWKTLAQLQDQLVSIPEYDWDPVLGACSAKGESGVWDEWSNRCSAFLREFRQYNIHLLPMTKKDQCFSCRVEYRKDIKTLRYTCSEGLWIAS